MKKKSTLIVGWLCLVMIIGSSSAVMAAMPAKEVSTMMCSQGVVRIGDTETNVRDKCGEPNEKERNAWIYDLGPSQSFSIIFKDRKVVRILESH